MKQRILFIPTILGAIIMVRCGGGESPKEASGGELPIPARVETVGKTSVTEGQEAVGTVQSTTTTNLSSKVFGYVLAVHVGEGDFVRSGQVLIEIDDRDMAAQVRKARAGLGEAENALVEVERAIRAAEAAKVSSEANLALASSTHERFGALWERRSVSRQEFDESEARYKSAVAEVNRANEILQSFHAKKDQVLAKIEQAGADVSTAQVVLGYTRITSPIHGLVTAKRVDVGDLASPGMSLLVVEDNRRYRLEAIVPESQLAHIRQGDQARVSIDALGEEEVIAVVGRIVPTADPGSRSFIVKLNLPSVLPVRSGMFGKAIFQREQKQTIAIARTALVRRGQLTGVYVLGEMNTAQFRLVKTGKAYGERIEILSGLNEGERIVVDGTDRIQEGSFIRGL